MINNTHLFRGGSRISEWVGGQTRDRARCQKEMDNEKHLIEQGETIPINRPNNLKYEDALSS